MDTNKLARKLFEATHRCPEKILSGQETPPNLDIVVCVDGAYLLATSARVTRIGDKDYFTIETHWGAENWYPHTTDDVNIPVKQDPS